MQKEYPKVSVIMPIIIQFDWQVYMTEAAIKIFKCTTKVPFELIIVETISNQFKGQGDKYIHFEDRKSYTRDFNAAIDIASGDILVQIANDVFVQEGWLEALLQCFEIKDCGAATLASKELRHTLYDVICESVSCPIILAFKKGYKFDEDFPNVMSDVDLIMRIYNDGYRMYRNMRAIYSHLAEQTVRHIYTKEEIEDNSKKYVELFKQKHQDSHLLMYHILATGQLV